MTTHRRPARFGHLDFNSPIAPWRADRLVANLAAARPATIVDIGCGWGELLLRLAAALPEVRATGVDSDAELLERGRANARARSLEGRVSFVEHRGEAWVEPADLVVCIGASHAFSGFEEALGALGRLVESGGRLVFGDMFWEQAPTAAQLDRLWPGASVAAMPDLAGLVDAGVAAGLRPLRIEAVDQSEWDDFESGFLADDEAWLLANADAPEAVEIREPADAHRGRWLRGHRHLVGFAYVTFARPF